jgi:hypothetical protein
MIIRQASPLALSVENPLLGIENATGFLASGPEQVANWYPKKKHGMFTYFFLKGLKGEVPDRRGPRGALLVRTSPPARADAAGGQPIP